MAHMEHPCSMRLARGTQTIGVAATLGCSIILRDLGGETRVVSGQTIDIMKKPNMIRVLVTTIVSMAAFALAPWSAHGQQAPVEVVREANAPLVEHLKVEDGIVWSKRGAAWINHDSATVGNAVKALHDLYPNATFAVDPRVAVVPLTDVMIRADDPMTDLQALRTSCSGRFDLHYQQKGLFTLEYNNSTEESPSKSNDRAIECFNLTGYLQEAKALDKAEANTNGAPFGGAGFGAAKSHTSESVARLQDIIQQSITAFDASIIQPHFQFYADAQMFIVIGSHRAIEVAAEVIHALPGQQSYQFVPPNAPSLKDNSNNPNKP
jgi:hypothetical protein